EHDLGNPAAIVARANELDAAPVLAAIPEAALAATSGMYLCFEDDRSAQPVKGLLCLGRRSGDDAARNVGAGGGEKLLCLIFVDFHHGFPGRLRQLRFYRTLPRRRQCVAMDPLSHNRCNPAVLMLYYLFVATAF